MYIVEGQGVVLYNCGPPLRGRASNLLDEVLAKKI